MKSERNSQAWTLGDLKAIAAVAILCLCASSVFPQAPKKQSYDDNARKAIRVFVFTASNPTGFVDADSKTLTATVDSLKTYLKKFTLVDDRSIADLSLEVVGRAYNVETGSSSTTIRAGRLTTTPELKDTVKIVLTAGEYSTIIDAISSTPGMLGVGSDATANAASRFDRWVRDNYDKLLALRTK